jgi:hypothetical protein
MSKIYSPKIVTDSLVMCLDASQNKSYPTTDLPVKNGLGLWLDASDDTTFSYSSGTSVSQWRDKSENNFHATQALSANQPSRSTTQNSRKTVTFDGTNDTVTIPNFVCNSEMSIFAVSNCGTTLFIEHSTDTNSNNGFYLYGAGGGMFAIKRGSIISYNALSNWINPGFTIASGTNSTGSDLLTYKDGTQTIPTSTNLNAFSNSYATTTLYIGSRGANSLWTTGPIAEIIIYNRKVNDVERKQIHSYLGQKWGILNTDRSIVDLSGNNDNGLLGNGTVANIPAYDFYNKGTLRFDGANDYVFLSNSQLNISSAITVEAWVKYNAQGGYNARSYSVITCKGYPWTWLLEDQSGQFNFRISTSVTADSNANSSYSHGLNTWNHVVGTYDGTSQKIYVDGVLRSTVSLTGTINTSSNDALVGCYNYGDYCLTGNVGVVRVYNKTLSAAEIFQNYESQKSRFANTIVQQGLILNLDAGNPYSYAGAGAVWIDVSGNTNNATLINSPTYSSDNSGVLNWTSASSQYATVVMTSGLRVTNITQEVWVFLNSTADQVFIGMQYGTGSNNSFALWVSGGTFYFGVNTGGTFYQSASSAPSTSTWYHLVHTYNGTTQYLYINGVLATTYNSAASGNMTYDTSNTLLAIGADFNGTGYNTGPTLFVNGKMPIVKIYNIALSAAQVLQNYNATKGRFGL